ncbi:MAG: MFS transporter [Dehalococcoidia bacterium]|nr:MAG: MFS transporter [Dehalococcoidia bacterium]
MARPELLTPPSPAASGRAFPATSPFRPLRHRNFRLLWLGTVVSNSGDWMDQVALNWLVFTLTSSPVYLALLNLCRSGPILLFTLLGGAIADRVERRRLMTISQTGAMLTAIALGGIALTGGTVWLVLALATLRGVLMSFNLPARQALISELVPREDLTATISLNSATLNLSRVIGPAIGGLLIASVGIAVAFWLNAASFLAVLIGLACMSDLPPRKPAPPVSVWQSVGEGLAFVARDPILRGLLVLALVPLVLGMSYQPMLAVFAEDVLSAGAAGLGLLTSAAGLGAVLGALLVGAVGGNLRRGRVMFAGLALFGSALLLFATARTLGLAALALLVVGMGSSLYQAINNALLQEHAPDALRGRVMSMLFLTRGMIPLGAMAAGIGATLVGAPAMLSLFAGLLLVLVALGWLLNPTVRELA